MIEVYEFACDNSLGTSQNLRTIKVITLFDWRDIKNLFTAN